MASSIRRGGRTAGFAGSDAEIAPGYPVCRIEAGHPEPHKVHAPFQELSEQRALDYLGLVSEKNQRPTQLPVFLCDFADHQGAR